MMKIKQIENGHEEVASFLNDKIAEFNWQRWEVQERLPLAFTLEDEAGNTIAGAAGRTFGDWLLLDTLWVDDSLRGQGIGEQLLEQMEKKAIERGCKRCLLDTLNFQAKPFYEARGYTVQWTQKGYPKSGCKYFMVKELA